MSAIDQALFDVDPGEVSAPRALTDRYIEPPLSTLDRRSGRWQSRRRQWMGLGIQSELGRGEQALYDFGAARDYLTISTRQGGTSIFDPVLCELVYRWYTAPEDTIVDPFAGGSVRGMVAVALGREYHGLDIRREQVEANRVQVAGWTRRPYWTVGDAQHTAELAPRADLIFTCPPYGDLEQYSDDPADLSTMPWADFLTAYRESISQAASVLRDDRFFAVVVGDLRGPDGSARFLPAETAIAMRDAGLTLYQEAIVLDPHGSKQMMAPRVFDASRKLLRLHQSLIVAVKGSWRDAVARLNDIRA